MKYRNKVVVKLRSVVVQTAILLVEQYEYLRWRRRGYTALGRPFKTIRVSPDKINSMISEAKFGAPVPRFGIVDGEWDRRAYPFEENAVFEMFEQHFQHGVPWEETATYQKRIAQLQRGASVPELDTDEQSRSAYEAYLDHWEGIYADINENGYRSQRELRAANDFANRIPSPLEEVELMIGRNGELICKSGKHRVTTAKLLGLESIPARVSVRHESWQALRERLVEATAVEKILDEQNVDPDHPDLADLIKESQSR